MKDFFNTNKLKIASNIVLFHSLLSVINLFSLLINSFGKSILYEDSYTLLYDSKSNFLSWLFQPHNGHIIVISRLITSFLKFISLNPTGYNISISIFILFCGILIIYKIIEILIKDKKLKTFTFYYCVFLWVSPFQWENLVWEFQFPWFLISFLVLSLTLINILEFKNIELKSTSKNLFFFFSPIIAILSSGQGICYVICLSLTLFFQKRNRKSILLGILISTSLFLYFRRDYSSTINLNIINNFQYLSLMLNSTFKASILHFSQRSFNHWYIPIISSFILNLTILRAIFFAKQSNILIKNPSKVIILLIPVFYGLLLAILLTLSRSQFGYYQGVVSRYYTSLNLIPIGLILISSYFFSKKIKESNEKELKFKIDIEKNLNQFVFTLTLILLFNTSSIIKTISETNLIYLNRQENFENFIRICKLNQNQIIKDELLFLYHDELNESVAVNKPPLPKANNFKDFKGYVNSDFCKKTLDYFELKSKANSLSK